MIDSKNLTCSQVVEKWKAEAAPSTDAEKLLAIKDHLIYLFYQMKWRGAQFHRNEAGQLSRIADLLDISEEEIPDGIGLQDQRAP